MKSAVLLILGSIAFAVLWTGGMLWSSGTVDKTDVIILSVCGVFAGIAWYYAMRWVFQHIINVDPPYPLPRNPAAERWASNKVERDDDRSARLGDKCRRS
ncbi:hypothetical protein JQ633_09780 [Bradyrhizobium tropiciagri]|uniref:hypothetical protein n=1 Tax=Bradyrhizobium tropiciagri TaxID=312253 RepID=UPI001BA80910|nr:hypothetical protein [Bradyrhizobium tropiciagri]MBR0870649.1 hypothetical protein [Bradyrhizobium tropiciagri]